MKKFIFGVVLICLVVSFNVSCMDNFLKENPKSELTTKSYYKTKNGAISAVGSVYNSLYSIYTRNLFLVGDKSADIEKSGLGQPNQELQNITFERYTSENSFIGNIWSSNYSGIHRANIVLDKIPNMIDRNIISQDLGNRLMGETKFLRALFYFNLVRFFGDVPLITKANQDYLISRTPESKVYDQIVKDLKYAAENLPIKYDDENKGRATKGTAKILLGKVYLYLKKYSNSVTVLGSVINNEDKYSYGLMANYADNFKKDTEEGKEDVFSVEYTGPPGHSNNSMVMQAPKYSIYKGSGIPCYTPTYEADVPLEMLPSLFSNEDSRKAVTFKTVYHCGSTKYTASIPLFGKYWQPSVKVPPQSSLDHHVMRYSVALLMYSEALFESGNEGNALKQINRVRERAFKDKKHDYSSLSEKKIWKEYFLETVDSGKRFFRLTREGRFVNVVKKHLEMEAQVTGNNRFKQAAERVKKYMTLMPIPQHEMDNNSKLEQNPEW
jgi:hypothetical protein